MTLRILATASPGEVRSAVLRGDTLLDYAIWRPASPDGVGDIHRGRVTARVPAMAGAFVALNGADGFLPDSEGAATANAGDMVTVRDHPRRPGWQGSASDRQLPVTESCSRPQCAGACSRAAPAHCWSWRPATRTPRS